MKSKIFKRIAMVALVVTLFSGVLLAGTLAKYTSTKSGQDSVTVAKWSFEVNDKDIALPATESFTLDLVPKAYDNVTNEMVAPGTQGSFVIKSENLGNVDASYTISFTVENKPTNLKFYYNQPTAENTGNFTVATNGKVISGSTSGTTTTYSYIWADDNVEANDGILAKLTGTETVTIYWAWDYETSNGDSADTTDGVANKNMTVNVTLTATQIKPVETTPAA